MKVVKLKTSMGAEGTTRAGQVLEVSEQRGRDLIRHGLARELRPGEVVTQLAGPAGGGARSVPMIPQAKPGKGAKGVPVSGPLALTKTEDGFRIGPAPSPSSSPADPAPPKQTSRKRAGKKGSASSSSTTAGA